MKTLFKKIDGKLMRKYPLIWETKVHLFLPIILVALLLLYGIGYVTPFDHSEDFDIDYYTFTPILVVPSVVLLVFWVINAVKFNVFKAGGKMHLGHDYLQIAIYFTIIFLTMQIPFVSVYGVHHKVRASFDKELIEKEADNLNKGFSVLTWNRYSVDEAGVSRYSIQKKNLVRRNYNDYNNGTYTYYNEDYVMNRDEMIQAIEQFKASVYKINGIELQLNTEEFVDENIESNFENGLNRYGYQLNPIDNYFGNVSSFGYDFFPDPFDDEEMWGLFVAFATFFTLVFWTFKRNKVKEFLFGLVAYVANPMVFGLFFAFCGMAGLLDGSNGEDFIVVVLWLGLLFYVVSLIIKLSQGNARGWFNVLSAMTIHLYTPIILLITIGITFTPSNDDFMFYVWLMIILSFILVIPVKKVYQGNWFFPDNK